MWRYVGTFGYSFEELPLVVQDHLRSGLVNGEASIWFRSDRGWDVERLVLEAWPKPAVPGVVSHMELRKTKGAEVFSWFDLVEEALRRDLGDHIQEAVDRALEEANELARAGGEVDRCA